MANIEHLLTVNAPVEKVYEALTTQEGLGTVWTSELSVSQTIGEILEFQFGSDDLTKMRLVELVPNKRIAWECVDSDPEWVGTSIVFDLSEKNGRTSITLGQLNWREVTPFYRSCNYNWAIFLYSLQLYVEEGKGMNYQSRFS